MEGTNAPEIDQDIVLQKYAEGGLSGFGGLLQSFLWKPKTHGVKRHVRVRDTDQLVVVLERFQEQPQILDPYLQSIVPPLAEGLLAYLYLKSRPAKTWSNSHLLTTLSEAICRLLYILCKVRGEKVIVRFLSTETKHLELLLSAIENGNHKKDDSSTVKNLWSWEERYVTLLWLSQLLLVPFDLESISSSSIGDETIPDIPGFVWPANVPGVSLRVISLAINYLSSSGKERDAAKLLLVRIALRSDMQTIGILNSLVKWAIWMLRKRLQVPEPVHHYIGLLSFLSGLLSSSAGTQDMNQYLAEISFLIDGITPDAGPVFMSIHESAVARKSMIKISRGIAILDLRNGPNDLTSDRTQLIIGTLLEYLADASTPVRLAASKALSMVTLKLDLDMSMQVVEAVLDGIESGVSWRSQTTKALFSDLQDYSLSTANVLQWHGHILTLSQLLYRRAVPASGLAPVLAYLIVGLSFEKRDTSGISVGTSVRDAACFGIWALARRYTTKELQSVKIEGKLELAFRSELSLLKSHSTVPVVQGLAIELVVSSCLDPAGNIRRGSSAALQELVGRHPDVVVTGINLVQVVDYHGIARRSAALQEVGFNAAKLNDIYFDALLSGLLGWRGVRDSSAFIRRDVAAVFGRLAWSQELQDDEYMTLYSKVERTIRYVLGRFETLPKREADERHGLLLIAATLIDGIKLNAEMIKFAISSGENSKLKLLVINMIELTTGVLLVSERDLEEKKPTDLVAEALSRLILSCFLLLRADIVFRCYEHHCQQDPYTLGADWVQSQNQQFKDILLIPDTPLWTHSSSHDPIQFLAHIQRAFEVGFLPQKEYMRAAHHLLRQFFTLKEEETVDAVSQASVNYIFLLNDSSRSTIVLEWIGGLEACGNSGRSGGDKAFIQTLFNIIPVTRRSKNTDTHAETLQEKVLNVLNWRWTSTQDIKTRTILLECLGKSHVLVRLATVFKTWLQEGLDDYTVDNRGDVGRHVRIEALKASADLLSSLNKPSSETQLPDQSPSAENAQVFQSLFGRILRSAAEKNDMVRVAAKSILEIGIIDTKASHYPALDYTKFQEYFQLLLELPSRSKTPSYGISNEIYLLEGYVLSAHSGSEDIVCASRAALVSSCEREPITRIDTLSMSLLALLKKNIGNDRVLVSVLEVIAFLFDAGVMQQLYIAPANIDPPPQIRWRQLFLLVQRAHYKTSNVRKLEAAVKVYGCLLEVYPAALDKLASMLLHPYPKIRNVVVEELLVRFGVGKGVDWTRGTKKDVERLVGEISVGRGAKEFEAGKWVCGVGIQGLGRE